MKKILPATVKFNFHYPAALDDQPVDVLQLDTRSANGLKRAKIETIGQLLDNWDKLGKIRNLGVESVKWIHAAAFAWMYENGKLKLVGGSI